MISKCPFVRILNREVSVCLSKIRSNGRTETYVFRIYSRLGLYAILLGVASFRLTNYFEAVQKQFQVLCHANSKFTYCMAWIAWLKSQKPPRQRKNSFDCEYFNINYVLAYCSPIKTNDSNTTYIKNIHILFRIFKTVFFKKFQ